MNRLALSGARVLRVPLRNDDFSPRGLLSASRIAEIAQNHALFVDPVENHRPRPPQHGGGGEIEIEMPQFVIRSWALRWWHQPSRRGGLRQSWTTGTMMTALPTLCFSRQAIGSLVLRVRVGVGWVGWTRDLLSAVRTLFGRLVTTEPSIQPNVPGSSQGWAQRKAPHLRRPLVHLLRW